MTVTNAAVPNISIMYGGIITISLIDTIPPAAPTLLSAEAGIGKVTLTWSANDEPDFLRYRIYGGPSANPTALLDSVGTVTDTVRVISGLTDGTTYYFRMTAVDDSSNASPFSNELSATPGDYMPPAAPELLAAAVGIGEVTLTWSANSEGDFLRYCIYSGTSANPTTIIDSVDTITDTVRVISGLTDGTPYYFRMTAVDTNSNESPFSNEMTATPGDFTAPAAPQILGAEPGDGQVTLTWSASSEADFLRYRIYGGDTPGPEAVLDSTAAIGDTSKTFTGLTNGTTYYYRVTAVDNSLNESDWSNEASATPEDITPPAAPLGLAAVAGDGQVILSWSPNTEPDFLRYRIYGGTAANPATVLDSTAAISDTTKTFTDLTNDTTYYYRVTAVDNTVNESAWSNEVSAAPFNSPPVAMADSVSTSEDIVLAIFVLVNDADPDSDTLTVVSVTQPAYGVAGIDAGDTTLTYAPNANFWGLDSLTYTISDGRSGLDTATVLVTVIPVNDPPVLAGLPDISFPEDSSAQLRLNPYLTDVDHDTTVITLTAEVVGSTDLIVDIDSDHKAYFLTNLPNINGVFTVILTATDPDDATDTDTIEVTVIPVNDPPVAVADAVTTAEDTAATVLVLVNDADLDGDNLTVVSVTQPAHGAAAIDAGDTTLTYTPDANFWGEDSLTYTVSDGMSGLDTATVLVTVTSVNDPPAAFALVSPGFDSTLVISNANLGDTLTFAWEVAVDVDGDTVRYGIAPTGDLGAILAFGDTTASEVRLPYADVAAIMESLGQLTITGTWDIFAADGEDTTWASNGPFTFAVDATTLDVLRQALLPQQFALHQNYPNPFNPSTTIRFDLPAATEVRLAIYDILGREVIRLADGRLEAGYHQQVWNGRDYNGREVPTGIYFVLVVTPEFRKSIKVVLLK